MKLRDVLVVLDGTARSDTVRDMAIGLARRHDAHLVGLCPLDLLLPVSLVSTLSAYPELLTLVGAGSQLEAKALEKAQSIEAGFREQTRRNDVRADWHVATDAAPAAVARRAGTADLVVLGQPSPDEPSASAARNLITEVLMNSGRPLLLVPFAGRFDAIGSTVLLGWNGTREAARAAHDALLLIEPEAAVTVLTIERGRSVEGPPTIPGADVAEHLARHGLKVSAARTVADNSIADTDALLNYASDCAADLLVVGGYGHSRVRELVLGGVSRELLDHMTVPVLMSH